MKNDNYKKMTPVTVARQEAFKYQLASNGEIEISRLNLLHSYQEVEQHRFPIQEEHRTKITYLGGGLNSQNDIEI